MIIHTIAGEIVDCSLHRQTSFKPHNSITKARDPHYFASLYIDDPVEAMKLKKIFDAAVTEAYSKWGYVPDKLFLPVVVTREEKDANIHRVCYSKGFDFLDRTIKFRSKYQKPAVFKKQNGQVIVRFALYPYRHGAVHGIGTQLYSLET